MFKTSTHTNISASGTNWVGTETFKLTFLGITIYKHTIPVVI